MIKVTVFVFLFCWFAICLSNPSGVLWQGFEHHWERRALGLVATPHRMGSFANYITNSDFSSSTSSFQVNQTFTPGVNGDYSYPKTYFSVLSDVTIVPQSISIPFQDNSTQGENPNAVSNITSSIQYTIPSGIGPNNIAIVLNGWRIDMACHSSEQPEGDICNSNGVWPYNLELSLSCSVNQNIYACDIQFELARSCDPSCAYGKNLGIDKAFNHVMDYELFVFFDVIYGTNLLVTKLPTIEASKITSEGNEFGSIVAQGSNGYNTGTIALQGFGFNLDPLTDKSIFEGKPGRYMESLTFKTKDVLYSENTGELAFDWEMGYYTTLTTFPSDGTYYMNPLLLQFQNSTSVSQSTQSPAGGAVCISDKFFKCEFNIDGVKLRQTTNDVTTVNLSQ